MIKRVEKDTGKRKTTEEFLQKLKDKGYYNENYDYSKVEYVGAFVKIIIIDKKYDTEHLLTPCKMLNRDDKCSIKNAVNKNEYFIKRSELIHGDKYDYSDVIYICGTDKIKIFCKLHKGFFEQSPHDHLSGSGCQKCGGTVKLTTKEFIIKSNMIHKDKYDYSEVIYKDAKDKVKILCKKHNEYFLQTPNSHLNGQGCPKCFGSIKLTNKSFIKKAIEIHGNKYNYSKVNYIDYNTKVSIRCNVCGHKFDQTPGNHLKGKGCKKCANNALIYTNEEFIEKAINVHGNIYDYSITNYKDSRIPIKIICKKHGIFEQTPLLHLRSKGCSVCNLSKGEIKIKNLLEELKIKYEPQKSFKDCKDKGLLKFDFYIPEDNLLIEYNGKQHYEPVKYWNHEKDFSKRQERDKIKVDYCKKNNISLLTIPYTKFNNIEEILMNKFNEIENKPVKAEL